MNQKILTSGTKTFLMRVSVFLILSIFLLSCKDKKNTRTKVSGPTDTISRKSDSNTVRKTQPIAAVYSTPGEAEINTRLSVFFGAEWHVVNDKEATWMKDAFDYFIVPRRKTEPTYPYISFGDYTGDGLKDTAALVTDSAKTNYAVAILSAKVKPFLWTEDITDDAAISNMQKATVAVMDGEKTKSVKLKSDAVNIEYFETASFLIYFEKGKYKRLQTGD